MIENEYRHGPTIVVCDIHGCDEVLTLDARFSDDVAGVMAESEDWRFNECGDIFCPDHADLA